MRPEFTTPRRARYANGFTMVEAIIAMTILGIVGGMIAIFIRLPVEGYHSSAQRAEMTDIADTAIRRISRDLQLAVPNSVRVKNVGGAAFLELLLIRTGGQYRAECSTAACTGEDILDFNTAAGDTGFDVIGGLDTLPAVGQRVVIFNVGVPDANAYAADNTAVITALNMNAAGGTISITPTRFPFTSPNQRFQVIESAVTYICAPAVVGSTGTGTLTRVSGYPITADQPTIFTLGSGVTSATLATRVSGCIITSPENMNLPGYALVNVRLTLQSSGETVSLNHEAHINNVP